MKDGDFEKSMLVPLGIPYQLLHSTVWGQHIGVSLDGENEKVQLTVYGQSAGHVRQRADRIVQILQAGKVIVNERKAS